MFHSKTTGRLSVALSLFGSTLAPLQANPAYLVADVNASQSPSAYSSPGVSTSFSSYGTGRGPAFCQVGNLTFFAAQENQHGRELWVTDGTEAGTRMVMDIAYGPTSSDPGDFANINGVLYFSAYTAAEGREVWKSDGTPQGTDLVADMIPGPDGSEPVEFTFYNNNVLFAVDTDPDLSGREHKLAKTDGTPQGSSLVGTQVFTTLEELTVANGLLFFSGDSNISIGHELYKSDGTTVELVKDIGIGSGSARSSNPAYLTPLGNEIYFSASKRLFKSDGTDAGTVIVKEDFSGDGFSPIDITNFNGTLVFSADTAATGRELWKSDGTQAGTTLIKDINPSGSSSVGNITVVGNEVWFRASDGTSGSEPWKTDGTTANTVLVKDTNPGPEGNNPSGFTSFNGMTIFATGYAAFPPPGSTKTLWKSDGSAANTIPVSPELDYDSQLLPLVFARPDSVLTNAIHPTFGLELWKTDGSAGGTVLVKNINPGILDGVSNPTSAPYSEGAPYQEKLVFKGKTAASGDEPWISDGTAPGTALLKDIYPGGGLFSSSRPLPLAEVNGKLLFTANTSSEGVELWATLGTNETTLLLNDLRPGSSGSNIDKTRFLTFGSFALFSASGTNSSAQAVGNELWLTDGTSAGTMLVKDIYPGTTSATPLGYTALGSNTLFFARTPDHGYELWTTDATESGTTMVMDIYPGSQNSIDPATAHIEVLGATAYFNARDENVNSDLWATDGTSGNTTQITDFEEPLYQPQNLTAVGDKLFYTAWLPETGRELWMFDPSATTATLVTDITPGPESTHFGEFSSIGQTLFFTANNNIAGAELWASDGTPQGTVLYDIMPGSISSSPAGITAVGNVLIFAAGTSEAGYELYSLTGEDGAPQLLQDIAPGLASSSPSDFVRSGNRVFFYANDSLNGRELWAVSTDELSPPTAAKCWDWYQ